MNIVFVVGMAGSGKTSLVGFFQEWLRLNEQNTTIVNLDPGVTNLPYNPDIDIRDHVNLEEIMEKYQLGPNGGLILAADLIGENIEAISDALNEIEPDIALVDTPGQIELFAFRESGPFIMNELAKCPKSVVYLFDGPFSSNPLNFVSNIYLAAAVHTRLLAPQVHVLTKVDLLGKEKLKETLSWSQAPWRLIESLNKSSSKTASLVGIDLVRTMSRTNLNFDPIPIASKQSKGFTSLFAALTRILTGGEELRP
ncbi:MAG: ATP/GTP-binding protein [Candidatus Bathyarchaeota archaeon]|nr:ATP/GTP-binding protein [Candidatus Bathyarchaeota archaeon]